MRVFIIFTTILTAGLYLFPAQLCAQEADSLNQQVSAATDDVVELGTTEIKIVVETPQIKLYSDRIKPEFDDVHLEKSFIKEIVGDGERFVFEELNKQEKRQFIDVDKLITRLR